MYGNGPYYLGETINDQIYNQRYQDPKKNKRGLNVYFLSDLRQISGLDQQGNRVSVPVQVPLFQLTPFEREDIVRKNSDILGITLSRQNIIAGLDWNIVHISDVEEKEAERLKDCRQIYHEYLDMNDVNGIIIRMRCVKLIQDILPEVRPDLKNFDSALMRWKRRIDNKKSESSDQIVEWVESMNAFDSYAEYKKKWVFNLLTHGTDGHYKEFLNNKLNRMYMLPGGTVYPVRTQFVSDVTAYIQMIQGNDSRVYFQDEISFSSWMPAPSRSYGIVPIESLINKIAESLLFDKLAAERADGTVPPEKLLIMGDKSAMFTGMLNMQDLPLPLAEGEQKKVETIVNEERKNAIRILSGHGEPKVVDISKADTFEAQSARQDKLKKDIGFVYQASPFEMGLTGSDNINGRNITEGMERQEKQRGVQPLVQIIDATMNRDILPYRFPGWRIEHKTELSEIEKLRIDILKGQDASRPLNQIRTERGDDPFTDPRYNEPFSTSATRQGSEFMNLLGNE
jgi:hypothetical protein